MVIFCPQVEKGENMNSLSVMLHDKKAYVGKEIQWSGWQIVSIEPLKVEG